MGYVIPVVLALGTFFWQICSVPGWFITLAARFRERTGDGAGFPEIRDFFRTAFAAGSEDHLRWMLIFQVVILVLSLIYILEHGGPGRLFRSSQCSILITAFGAVVFQIALLKQHSGVHEFSMIKVSWWIAMMAPVTAILILKVLSPRKKVTENGSNPLLSWLMVFFLLGYSGVLFITGIPSWDRPYYNYRNKVVQYPVAEAVRDNTAYTDVCFSFNSQIGLTPPMDLAVSGKQVWRVDSLTDIETRFPGLRDRGARYLMVFDKAGEEVTAEQKDLLDLFMTEPYIIYEDSSCVIAEIPDWNVGV